MRRVSLCYRPVASRVQVVFRGDAEEEQGVAAEFCEHNTCDGRGSVAIFQSAPESDGIPGREFRPVRQENGFPGHVDVVEGGRPSARTRPRAAWIGTTTKFYRPWIGGARSDAGGPAGTVAGVRLVQLWSHGTGLINITPQKSQRFSSAGSFERRHHMYHHHVSWINGMRCMREKKAGRVTKSDEFLWKNWGVYLVLDRTVRIPGSTVRARRT